LKKKPVINKNFNSKISKRELNRRYKDSQSKIIELTNGNRSLRDLTLFLAIELYINNPENEIFINGSFKDDFFEEVKKGAKKKLEKNEK